MYKNTHTHTHTCTPSAPQTNTHTSQHVKTCRAAEFRPLKTMTQHKTNHIGYSRNMSLTRRMRTTWYRNTYTPTTSPGKLKHFGRHASFLVISDCNFLITSRKTNTNSAHQLNPKCLCKNAIGLRVTS